MRLKGSITELEFRKVLLAGSKALFKNKEDMRLLNILIQKYGNIETAYFLEHIPDQGEDIYTLLINNEFISVVEIDHELNIDPVIDTFQIQKYLNGLSKINQIKFAVARDLASQKIIE
jgi:hypothetical protein